MPVHVLYTLYAVLLAFWIWRNTTTLNNNRERGRANYRLQVRECTSSPYIHTISHTIFSLYGSDPHFGPRPTHTHTQRLDKRIVCLCFYESRAAVCVSLCRVDCVELESIVPIRLKMGAFNRGWVGYLRGCFILKNANFHMKVWFLVMKERVSGRNLSCHWGKIEDFFKNCIEPWHKQFPTAKWSYLRESEWTKAASISISILHKKNNNILHVSSLLFIPYIQREQCNYVVHIVVWRAYTYTHNLEMSMVSFYPVTL